MTEAVVVRQIRPWQGYRSPRLERGSIDDLTPPRTPGRTTPVHEFGTPDWRWRETEKIYNSISSPEDYRPLRGSDPLIAKQLVPFVWSYKTATRNLTESTRTRRRYPDQWWAFHTHTEEKITAYFVQAAILARAPVEEIARHLSVYPEQVWWYEKMFFDVRAFADNETWVVLNIFFPALQRFGPLSVQDFLWKGLAWGREIDWPTFLQAINPLESPNDEIQRRIVKMIESKMLADTLLAVFKRTPNSYNENFIVDQYLKTVEIDKVSGSTTAERDNNLMVFMQTIKDSFHMASIDRKFKGVESRAHEDLVHVYQERSRQVADAERTLENKND